jgi:hypothetical protein
VGSPIRSCYFLLQRIAERYRQFGHDPDGVFSSVWDDFGFAERYGCEVIFSERSFGNLSGGPATQAMTSSSGKFRDGAFASTARH